ncbi:MAG: tRNA (5-methylaminomethyl-2-thiouridine)(34)-methyltransferase MnmD [Pseudomonadota bacterium]
MINRSDPLRPARLAWRDDEPFATDYQDIYHSPDGPGEVNRVFYQPADLDGLLAERQTLTIAEFGFGTALNLAVLLDRWRGSARPRLHYLSCELHPLAAADWNRVVRQRARTSNGYRELENLYPPLVPGWHRRTLAGGRIVLSLFWGTAAEMLAQLNGRQRQPVDLWLLDGFAPDRNPELWDPALLTQLPVLSREDTVVTTFTAAGRVRRALAEGGFEMRRVDQRPYKRESLAGILRHAPDSAAKPEANVVERKVRDCWQSLLQRARAAPVEVIGAGIAGALLARHLADAGLPCRIFDAGPGPMGASRLPAVVAHARLLADGSPAAAQRALAQLYSSHYLAPFLAVGQSTAAASAAPPPGCLQLASGDDGLAKLERLASLYGQDSWCQPLSGAALEALCRGFAPQASRALGLWFPEAWIVRPQLLIQALLDHPLIDAHWHRPIDLTRASPALRCLTVGSRIGQLPAARFLELAPLGGQLDRVRVTSAPTAALVGAGYCVPDPARPGEVLVGGNYEYRPWAPADATAANLQQLPGEQRPGWRGRHRGLRLTTSDRQPVVGLLYQADGQPTADLPLISLGFGSQGLTQAPLAAAVLVSRLLGQVPPLSPAQERTLDARRFIDRQHRRGPWRGAQPQWSAGR